MKCVVLALFLAFWGEITLAEGSGEEKSLFREGVTELNLRETAILVAEATRDSRYIALYRVAVERELKLDLARARALRFPEGYLAVFIPVIDADEREAGAFASGAGRWTLSLALRDASGLALEGLEAIADPSGFVKVEVASAAFVDAAEPDALSLSAASSDASCLYVASYWINYSCWSPDENPFAYYHAWVYRFGTTPDPMNPSWWACWQGYIHVCPRYESQGSPITFPVCGFPPSHPQG